MSAIEELTRQEDLKRSEKNYKGYAVLCAVKALSGENLSKIAKAADCSSKVAKEHLERFINFGVVEERREGRSLIYNIRAEAVQGWRY